MGADEDLFVALGQLVHRGSHLLPPFLKGGAGKIRYALSVAVQENVINGNVFRHQRHQIPEVIGRTHDAMDEQNCPVGTPDDAFIFPVPTVSPPFGMKKSKIGVGSLRNVAGSCLTQPPAEAMGEGLAVLKKIKGIHGLFQGGQAAIHML